MKSDLRLTGIILNVLEVVGWLAIAGSVILAWNLFSSTTLEVAGTRFAVMLISALGFIALIRTGKAVVMIAAPHEFAGQVSPSIEAPAARVADEAKRDVGMDYRGYSLISTGDGVSVAGKVFPNFNAARQHVDELVR